PAGGEGPQAATHFGPETMKSHKTSNSRKSVKRFSVRNFVKQGVRAGRRFRETVTALGGI
ncbi:hypothetical protein, partial [Mesorhizobium sp. CO1-1-8]|uniref:hypothetical protein n=1 Tax=Mesorhizobium sp. CO1-1-8 TaxID=2876631 RepID=UPI001CD0F991